MGGFTTGTVVSCFNPNLTLLNTRLLNRERIVAEFTEQPTCSTLCCVGSGTVRHIQLTTQRLLYSESHRSRCSESKPMVRQIFIKDVCDIMVEGAAGYGCFKTFANFLFMLAAPIIGSVFIALGVKADNAYDESGDYSTSSIVYYYIGGVLLFVWLACLLYRFWRKNVPHIIIGTRCPHLPPFAIRLRNPADRMQLLEEMTTLMNRFD